jgi:hypothetical protein
MTWRVQTPAIHRPTPGVRHRNDYFGRCAGPERVNFCSAGSVPDFNATEINTRLKLNKEVRCATVETFQDLRRSCFSSMQTCFHSSLTIVNSSNDILFWLFQQILLRNRRYSVDFPDGSENANRRNVRDGNADPGSRAAFAEAVCRRQAIRHRSHLHRPGTGGGRNCPGSGARRPDIQ